MDVCVVGHVTKDLIRIPGKPDQKMAGGSAYYVSIALKSLGLSVEVITKVAKSDDALLDGLRARGIAVINGETNATTTFENAYNGEHLAKREQWVRDIAAPFSPRDLEHASAAEFHLGPLTANELSLETLRFIRARARRITFDGQGVLREVVDEAVRLGAWAELEHGLPLVDALKVDDVEAARMVNEKDPERAAQRLAELGAREVAITFADRGSLVRAGGKAARIPAFPPAAHVDATGCGDTYAAGYLAARYRGASPIDAARFAAAAASLKLERYGALEASSADVEARMIASAQSRSNIP
jgi:sugar/nucleoside kinase (ribokinase family)